METVTIKDRSGKSIEIDILPLDISQIRALKPHGFSLVGCSAMVFDPASVTQQDLDRVDDALWACLDTVLTESQMVFLSKCSRHEATRIWKSVIAETYGGGDDQGNSSGTSDGTTTATE